MSLRVWLPLTGHLNNQGVDDITVTNNGATVDNSGKLGKCYNFSTGYISIPNIITTNTQAFSISVWVYVTSINSYGCVLSGRSATSGKGIALWITSSRIRFDDGENWQSSYTFPLNTWTHIAVVWSLEGKSVYVNGVQIASKSTVGTLGNLTPDLWIGDDNQSTAQYKLNGSLNDVRIYDHALSLKEIKLLSQGLVCHYPLNDRFIGDNLILNGFGQDGLLGWSNSSYSTTEIPSTPNYIKASYTGDNTTTDFLPISHNTTYTFSEYLKASTASGTTYPSILPYDIDKHFIAYYHCAVGFNPNWSTTLAQPLNPGDTVVHATDLSSWTTDTTSYYYYVAVFGYTDSTGHVYEDFTYTQDSLKFGTRADKSNLDKTTNTITLLSPYTGKARPAGTAICQATAGASYFYPFGGISVTTITDWTYKSTVIDPKITNGRLFCAQYIKYLAYPSAYHAGIQLVDNNANNIICDSSGFSNNGQLWSYDAAGSIVASSVTPRYLLSTFINSDNNTTNTASGTRYIYGNCTLKAPDKLTVAFWCNPIAGYGGGTTQGQLSLTNNVIGNTAASDYQTAPLNHRDGGFDVNSSDGTIHKRLYVTFTANEWHHYAITYDGRYAHMYTDGYETASIDMGANVALGDMCGIVLGFSKAGNLWRSNKSSYSDFRMYTTCLSADDVLELYHTSASIDKNGNLYAYELKEE